MQRAVIPLPPELQSVAQEGIADEEFVPCKPDTQILDHSLPPLLLALNHTLPPPLLALRSLSNFLSSSQYGPNIHDGFTSSLPKALHIRLKPNATSLSSNEISKID